jgi:septum formation protein
MTKDFIYLASASPRRRALLEQIGVRFQVLPANVCEAYRSGESSETYVTRVAEAKAETVWSELSADRVRPVLAADTAVVLGSRIFGKPRDESEAMAMLAELSGCVHRVLTAVALRDEHGMSSALCSSEVAFRSSTEAERRAYCSSGEPMDKAGAYGAQGLGAVFIEHIKGSFSAIVGLPLAETAALLHRVNQPQWLYDGELRR